MNDQHTLLILNLLHAVQEICPELYTSVASDNTAQFWKFHNRMSAGIAQVLHQIEDTSSNGSIKLRPVCQSILDSLRRIGGHYRHNQEMCLKKIEFELLPLLQEAYLTCYFFQYLADHPEHLAEYHATEKGLLCGNAYIDEAMETGRYKYEVSIFVLAYNKLDYTKRCVESLLANLPAGLNYELILVNHGSTDGTKEYFESICPHKQMDIAVNGGGVSAVARIVEGKFTIQVSNDVIITPHAIENLLACIRSDPKIAWAVPATSNISNLQTIPAQYGTLDELTAFAQKNNRQDSFRWEQRVRLCNPIDIWRNSVLCASNGLCLNGAYHTFHPTHSASFPDDRFSLLLRRHGYKIMLAKDAYCHHFGSVTLKDEITQQNERKYYLEGRQEFYKAFGVDPWGTGFCYDTIFMNRVVGDEQGHVDVLGINCGLGSNSLKIKEQIKEYCHNTDCTLSNITDDSSFLLDLKGISDEAALIHSIKEFKSFLYRRTFRYIVWETAFLTQYKFSKLLSCCLDCLAPGGKLLIKLTKQSQKGIVLNYPQRKELGNNWIVLEQGARE